MAKKKSAEVTEEAGQGVPAAEVPKTPKAEKPKGEKKPRKAEQAAAPEKAAPAPVTAAEKTMSVSAAGEPSKKKNKRPGVGAARGKKLRKRIKENQQTIAKLGVTSIDQAVEHLKKMKRSKMDETVEVHMALGVDVTQSDQIVRGTVSLPHGIGKSVRVLVFCQADNIAKAQEAGADYAGDDELIKKVQGGWTDFDVALATQDMMGKVSRLGKILGPRGLMPTPKAGTVITSDIAGVVRDFKAGKVEYRTDKTGNIHAGVGKLSFDKGKLIENIHTFVEQVKAVKPSGVRGQYIKSVFLSATMSPSIPVTV